MHLQPAVDRAPHYCAASLRLLVSGGMGYMVLNAISRISKCMFFDTEQDAYWFNMPNYLHILITVLVVLFFKLPGSGKKGSKALRPQDPHETPRTGQQRARSN